MVLVDGVGYEGPYEGHTGLVPWAKSGPQLRALLLQSQAMPRSPLTVSSRDAGDFVQAWLTARGLAAATPRARAS